MEQVKLNLTINKLKLESGGFVTGLVYPPMEIDSENDLMLEEDIILLKERMEDPTYNVRIDVGHSNNQIDAEIKSLTISKDHEYYTDGSLIAKVKVNDTDVWKKIEQGEYNGFSIEFRITPVQALALVEVEKLKFGDTVISDGHKHKYWAELDAKGNILRGRTSEEGEGEERHYHTILENSVTTKVKDHSHGIQL